MDQARPRALLDGKPIPDERLEADPLAELTIAEAAAGEADADEEADDEPEPDRSQDIHVERDDRPR
jgi:RNA polymerase-binding transcription factor DksA